MLRKMNSLFRKLINGLFGGTPPIDDDPFAGSPVRNKRGPNDRTAAVAVAEPDDE
jgi:hypothetical protein